MDTLSLTSPHLKGEKVKTAQKRLQENKFKTDFLQGDVDGEFGPETARGCKRAKYWLGYRAANMEPNYGEHLDDYLTGAKKLPRLQQTRRNQRLKKLQDVPLREKAIVQAKKNIGMKESPPESNRCLISVWWGLIGPWCDMAVSRWYILAGSKAFKRGVNWAYVPAMLVAAIMGEHSLSITRNPLPGDIACFDWDDDGIADHTGILITKPNSQGFFDTIEGNTSYGNNSNGGEVMERRRNVSDVAKTSTGKKAFIHVGG